MDGCQGNELKRAVLRNNGVGHHGQTQTRLGVQKDRSNQARAVVNARRKACIPTTCQDSIMQPNSLAPSQHQKRCIRQGGPWQN